MIKVSRKITKIINIVVNVNMSITYLTMIERLGIKIILTI